jgi:hypothetical protein
LKEIPATKPPEADDIDISLLEDSLAMTPWERMQAPMMMH